MTQSVAIIKEESRLQSEIRDIRRKIETEAWQCFCPFVLRDGDKNTSYFHYRVSHRRKRNKIESLIDSEGVVRVEQEEIMRVVFTYYLDLCKRFRPPISVDQIEGIKA